MPLGVPAPVAPPTNRTAASTYKPRGSGPQGYSYAGTQLSPSGSPQIDQPPGIPGGLAGPPMPANYTAPQYSAWGTPYKWTDPSGQLIQSQLDALNKQTRASNKYNIDLGLLGQNQYADNIGFANRDSALQKQALGVGQYQDVTLAGGRAQQQFDTAQTKFATDMARINQQSGLTDAERAEKLRAAQATYQDTVNTLQSNYQFNTADLNSAAVKDQRLARSDATGRGAIGSLGYQQGSNEIANQLQSGLGRQSANLQLGTTGAQNGLTASNNATELQYQGNQLQLQQQRDASDAAAKQAALDKKNSDDYLKTVADQYGIRQDQVDAALERGLSALGYDAAATTAQLAQAAASNNANAAAQAAALQYQAMVLGVNHPISKPAPKPVAHTSATRYS